MREVTLFLHTQRIEQRRRGLGPLLRLTKDRVDNARSTVVKALRTLGASMLGRYYPELHRTYFCGR